MLKHVLLASAALALLAAPSFAGNTSTVTLAGHVKAVCSVVPKTTTIKLGNIDLTGGMVTVAPITVESVMGEAWCNGAGNKIAIVATSLKSTTVTTVTPGFDNFIDYTLASNDGLTGTLDSSLTGNEVDVTTDAFDLSGQANGTVTPKADGTQKVVAGDYEGTVAITLTPGA